MAAALRRTKPQLVFVGRGSPKQERVIARPRSLLPQAWWLGVGVAFSFLAKQIKRAPGWMQSAGLEWTYRLACEPTRLAKRYLVDDLPFAFWLLARGFREIGPGARPIPTDS